MKIGWQPRKWLEKKAKRGMHGFPVGTIAFYGPDNRRASKVAVGIASALQSELTEVRRWFAEAGDARKDDKILTEITTFLREKPRKNLGNAFPCPLFAGRDGPEAFRREVKSFPVSGGGARLPPPDRKSVV